MRAIMAVDSARSDDEDDDNITDTQGFSEQIGLNRANSNVTNLDDDRQDQGEEEATPFLRQSSELQSQDEGATCFIELLSKHKQGEIDSNGKKHPGTEECSSKQLDGDEMDSDEARQELLKAATLRTGREFGSLASSLSAGSERSANLSPPASALERNDKKCAEANRLRKGSAISRSMLELDKTVDECDKFKVAWQSLDFSYTDGMLFGKRKQVPVLRDISGHFESNELVAIIGPSGCGKTTLLQFLAGNLSGQRDKMRIMGIDQPKVAFIGQDDVLLSGLSALETLVYASRLQNQRRSFDHVAHVRPIMSELGLDECATRSVTKLSGGQAKRVTIAQELLYPTNILILDEVTSGLDASTSYSIVKLLKQLVSDSSYPMSIVMSIHQPSARLFSVFDRVYVMSQGLCLYEGSCQAEQINGYLGQFGLQCPHFHNIADYLIEIACCSSATDDMLGLGTKLDCEGDNSAKYSIFACKQQMVGHQRKHNQDLLARLCATDQQQQQQQQQRRRAVSSESPLDAECAAQTNQHSVSLLMDNGAQHQMANKHAKQHHRSLYEAIELARSSRARPFCDQFLVHFNRSLLRIRRSPILTYLQMFCYILIALQLTTFYGPQIGHLSGCPRPPTSLASYMLLGTNESADSDDQDSHEMRRIQENMNFLLVAVLSVTFASLEITVITFPLEARTIRREWRNGWYRVTSYFMGRTLADLPFTMSAVLVFSLVAYSATGQLGLGTWRFGSFCVTLALTALVSQAFGFIFGAIFMNNLPAAVFVAPLSVFPTLLFSGFFGRLSQVPAFYRPVMYLSHFRYTFDALLVTIYGYNRCECDQALLDSYYAGLANQSESLRDMFAYMFGSNECAPEASASANLIAREDFDALSASNASMGALLGSVLAADRATTSGQHAATKPALVSSLEDAIVNELFRDMANGSAQSAPASSLVSTTIAPDVGEPARMNAMDRLAHKFSQSTARMLSRQANFGRPTPRNCTRYGPYLLQEFELQDDDLFTGLVMLFVFVVVSRLMCNVILNFTIATRAR